LSGYNRFLAHDIPPQGGYRLAYQARENTVSRVIAGKR
jgi:hypothetical protein